MTYTEESIRASVKADEARFLAPWREGRPEGYTPGPQMRDLLCIGAWLREELTRSGVSDDERRKQERLFNSFSRGREDLFRLAAEILNHTVRLDGQPV
jgi:hypothetical protein